MEQRQTRSTSLDTWSPEQLKKMVFGGNNTFEAKYTSRAANLYRRILAEEVAKAMAEETTSGLPLSVPVSLSRLLVLS
ncbi:unnamed protein product [Arabis nemorensis]|uniref:Arf-GAP domain-containing protein n=1 Tax=Arabis nemorensis TaxID=586526 RepID=A0A565CI17_9BRAS|nr:unnamed protein product [Arabis nemorensis]